MTGVYHREETASKNKSELLEKQHTLDKINEMAIDNLVQLANIEFDSTILLCDFPGFQENSLDNRQIDPMNTLLKSLYDQLHSIEKKTLDDTENHELELQKK